MTIGAGFFRSRRSWPPTSASPSSTASMPGLLVSSSCIALLSRLMILVGRAAFVQRNFRAVRGQVCEQQRRSGHQKWREAAHSTVILAEASCVKPLSPVHWNAMVPLLGRHRVERDERIGGDGLVERGLENFLAVVGADKRGDDVARDRLADVVVTEAGFHDVRDQRLDLNDLAALGLLRNVDEGARGHQGNSSRQAPSVMMTSTLSDQNEPSDNSQMATTCWVSASRMRVEISALPARGPSSDADDIGLRVLLGEDVDRFDVVLRRHRAFDRNAHRHGVAVLNERRQVELDLAGLHMRFADDLADRRRHRSGRGLGRPHDQKRACAGGCSEEFAAGRLRGLAYAHLSLSVFSDTPPRPRSARPSAPACRENSAPRGSGHPAGNTTA